MMVVIIPYYNLALIPAVADPTELTQFKRDYPNPEGLESFRV